MGRRKVGRQIATKVAEQFGKGPDIVILIRTLITLKPLY